MTWINRTEIRLIGLSRSGNHALVHWMLAQAQGRAVFLNCCEGKQNPYDSARPMGDGALVIDRGGELDLEAERAGRFSRKDWLLFNHEDSFLGHACSDVYEERHDEWVGPSRRRHDVLVLRDPFNLLASRLRAGTGSIAPRLAMRIWKQHARELLRPRRLRRDPVLVSYDRWCTDRGHRREVAERLGLRFSDAGRQRVCATHGGSSFDGLAFDGRADEMRVLERWRAYADDPRFLEPLDPEVFELAERIFGNLPGAESLRRPRGGPSAARSSRSRVARAYADSTSSGSHR